MKYFYKTISALFVYLLLSGCGGGHDRAGSSESSKSLSVINWPVEQKVNEDELYSYKPQVQSTLSGMVSYSVEGLPEWADFNSQTGEVSGTPGNKDSGRKYSGIKITVLNNGPYMVIGPFSIDVLAVNDAPEILAQSVQANKSEVTYDAELTYTDIDNAVSQLKFEVTKQPSNAEVVMVANSNKVKITPKTFDAFVNEQYFEVKVSDGELESESVRIDLSFMDESDFTFHSNIPNGANILRPDNLLLNSSHPVTLEQLTGNSSVGDCIGKFQISHDGFKTCIPFQISVLDNFNRQFSVIAEFDAAKVYQYQVQTALQNVFQRQPEGFLNEFSTIGGVIITEVGGSAYNDVNRWFEIFNATRSAIDVSSYALRSPGTNRVGAYMSVREFPFPSYVLQPGQYLIVRSQNFESMKNHTRSTVYLGDNTVNPSWYQGGYLELVDTQESPTTTIDIVGFGSVYENEELITPISANAWMGDYLDEFPGSDSQMYPLSYQRSGLVFDTNKADDWTLASLGTPGGPNDVTCYSDTDLDGIPDCSEREGTTFAGIDLYSMGAREDQKDIFIEIDYMDLSDEGVIPRKEAIDKVVAAFLAKDVHVHFDLGGLFEDGSYNLGGGNRIPESQCLGLEKIDGCASLYEIKGDHFDLARLFSFHYFVFGYSQELDGSAGSSGRAEINGNDGYVTLGNWGLNSRDEASLNQLINFQASTLMHELGHNLGLRHGGTSDSNRKPNYISVMNYLYQLNGLPTIGNNEGDRYYDYFNSVNCPDTPMTNPPWGAYGEFVMDYSDGRSLTLNERAVDETLGLGRIGSVAVDFDCADGIDQTPYQIDVNDDDGYSQLSDHNDWANLNLRFQYQYNVTNHGRSLNDAMEQEYAVLYVGDDRSEVSQEEKPDREFFDNLNAKKAAWQVLNHSHQH